MLERTGLSGEDVDDIRWGGKQVNEQSNNIARVIALLSDPARESRHHHRPLCASSAGGDASASDAIRAGQREVIVAGGVENVPQRTPKGDRLLCRHRGTA